MPFLENSQELKNTIILISKLQALAILKQQVKTRWFSLKYWKMHLEIVFFLLHFHISTPKTQTQKFLTTFEQM